MLQLHTIPCVEVHSSFNHSLNDGHLLPILAIIGNTTVNDPEAEFLGERICAFVIQTEISNLLFPPGIHHSSLLFLHLLSLESVPAYFSLLKFCALLRYVCMCRERWVLSAKPGQPRFQAVPIRTEGGFEIKSCLPETKQCDLATVFGIPSAYLFIPILFLDIQI